MPWPFSKIDNSKCEESLALPDEDCDLVFNLCCSLLVAASLIWDDHALALVSIVASSYSCLWSATSCAQKRLIVLTSVNLKRSHTTEVRKEVTVAKGMYVHQAGFRLPSKISMFIPNKV